MGFCADNVWICSLVELKGRSYICAVFGLHIIFYAWYNEANEADCPPSLSTIIRLKAKFED